jgi:hypothetical protein
LLPVLLLHHVIRIIIIEAGHIRSLFFHHRTYV